jgi:acetoin utilization protein AcuC
MGCTTRVMWQEALTAYDFGPGHPLAPVRLELTMALARQLGVLELPGVDVAAATPADDALLTLVHHPEYVAAVRAERRDLGRGLGLPDNPVFAGMHDAAALITGASVAAARAVWSGERAHAVNVSGGLHHAMPGAASGFCVYNDAAVAIADLLDAGAKRIAYVDTDAHHGDGVQHAFYDDRRVLTISLHQSGHTLFPGTGFPGETGAPGAEGYAVNVALPPGTGDAGWLRAFHAVVPELLAAFEPQVVVSQHGCDSHLLDPLTSLALSVDGQRAAQRAVHRLAHERAAGRWVALGGGGYALAEVVPRVWTHLLAEAAGAPVAPETPTPAAWRALVEQRTGESAPAWMTDGAPASYQPYGAGLSADRPDGVAEVDRAIAATRRAVFPAHGLPVA